MSKIEPAVRKRARKQNIQQAVLATIGITGLLAASIVAPNAVRLLKYTPLGAKRASYRAQSALARLVTKGDIEWVAKGPERFARLTPKGRLRLARLMGGERPRRWDRKWRIVIFDINEKKRRARDLLRYTLMNMGFFKLQNSVWIYPYDCEDLISLLKSDFSIGRDVLYIVS